MTNTRLWLVSLAIFTLLPYCVSASDWTQFQHDTYNSGTSMDKAPITYPDLNLSWDYTFSGTAGLSNVYSPPLVVNDTVYAVTPDGSVSAINKRTGIEKWSISLGYIGYQLGAPAFGNSTLFIPTYTGKIFTIDAENGNVAWNISHGGKWGFTPVTYDEHRIFFGYCSDWEGTEGKYYCYYDNGTKGWERDSTTTGGYYWAGATVVGDFLIFGDSEGFLTSVYKEKGTLRDEINVASVFGLSDIGSIKSSVSYNEMNSKLYFTSEGASKGYLLSIVFNEDGTFDVYDKCSVEILPSTSTPAYYNGRVYAGSGDHDTGGKLYCFNGSDLSEIWEYVPNGGIKASPVISTAYDDGEGEVYIYFTTNTDKGRAYCLRDHSDNNASEEVWYYQPPSDKYQYILQGVAISDGWLYFGNDGGYLFGLATEESIKIAAFEAEPSSGIAPLTVQFNDTSIGAVSWEWDVDGDGEVDHYDQNPVHVYTVPGKYTVSINVTSSNRNDMLVMEDYIYVGDDWNPWNDEDSEGIPDGSYITIDEVIEAYNCWRYDDVSDTGYDVSIDDVIEMYNAWRFNVAM
ncbi:outer membrane protein assembly factor BamB family protein [Methanolobus profundi]|uniref:Outer membrane protein assembly factor BamB, contains PQQ-like beta-propeller repeat n=1 Tax=Methanolobus profundi TaxID=487685 RepID=A0A1I4PF75_9EURY|nr:PQQ-binding-like beta-propeller repeat protein [Methanolobus profundi]SFM26414.1 Outer membrane protein assembly factor BamB, contains PQQ-like beta-propeller repeat [Methanolobus profundi]